MVGSASAPDGHEALRRAALDAVHGSRADASELKRRYAEACVKLFAAPVPLLWPRRTRGHALRIVVVVGASRDPVVEAALKLLSDLPRESFQVAMAGTGGIPLDAKRLAALDPDVLLDLAGVTADLGPLLAQRPARAIMTIEDLEARNAPPLIDGGETPVRELPQALAERHRALPADGAVPDAAGTAKLWTDAVLEHQRGDLAAARQKYAHVLSMQPGYAPGYFLLGMAQKDAGELAAARRSLTAAVEAAPGFIQARIAAAKLAEAEGDSTGAIAMLADGILATATPLALHRALGTALLGSGDGARAAEAFADALRIDAGDAETHYNHGVALQMQRRRDEAAAAYRRSLALRPDMVAAEFNLGTLYQEQGATDAAVASYRRVLARDPGDVAAYKNLGEA